MAQPAFGGFAYMGQINNLATHMNHEIKTKSDDQVLTTGDGSLTLIHPIHGEAYHSKAGALREARELYVHAGGYASRLDASSQTLSILDVGLGLGYNACASVEQWVSAAEPGELVILSLESDARLFTSFKSGQAPWQTAWPGTWRTWAESMKPLAGGFFRAMIPHPNTGAICTWYIRLGDAVLLDLSAYADLIGDGIDFVWQDPFSPKKNPPLWGQAWFENVRRICKPDTTLMTYSVARSVKGALQAAGWSYEIIETHGSKRHWLRARPVSQDN